MRYQIFAPLAILLLLNLYWFYLLIRVLVRYVTRALFCHSSLTCFSVELWRLALLMMLGRLTMSRMRSPWPYNIHYQELIIISCCSWCFLRTELYLRLNDPQNQSPFQLKVVGYMIHGGFGVSSLGTYSCPGVRPFLEAEIICFEAVSMFPTPHTYCLLL